jgi:lipopolysaccharide biosynthesis glycosyltransferase
MSTDCTVCYVSDLDFLLPSLVSAARVRKYVPAHKADVVVFTVGVYADKIKETAALLKSYDIRIVSIDDRVFEAIDRNRLAVPYTPIATFGRFFLEELLPAACRRIVYLDGDILCAKDCSVLIDAVVPEGRFAAAEDIIFYRQRIGRGGTAKGIRDYFAGLGLSPDDGYFNAGVFAVQRSTWRSISREAYAFYLSNMDICKNWDQSALNAVVGERRLRLSARWNFQTQHKIWGVDKSVPPVLCHFNRFPKPWMGACEPWKEMYAIYRTETSRFASLKLPLKTLATDEIEKFNAETNRSYSYLRLPFVSRVALRSMGFDRIEREHWI